MKCDRCREIKYREGAIEHFKAGWEEHALTPWKDEEKDVVKTHKKRLDTLYNDKCTCDQTKECA